MVTEKIDFENTTSETDITIYPFFIDVLNDYASFAGPDVDIVKGAVDQITGMLTSSQSAENLNVTNTGENSYNIAFTYSSISDLLKALGGGEQDILIEKEGSLSFYLDINNYGQLKKIIPILSDVNFEVYAAEYNQGMSESDYLEMIYYLLGSEAPDAVRESEISITITLPSEITASKNVEILDSNTARYTFSLLSFLLLNEPLSFSLTWNAQA